MNPNRALWEKGDFTKLAATMRESAETLVASLGLEPGMKVLDLGCGDGTTVLPAAKRGAEVLGVDIAANLVEAGRKRAAAAGLNNLRFQQGDACELTGLEDKSFDRVVTIFGAMFAPKPFEVAKEMVRVTKPGGLITMGNWIPHDPTLVAQVLRISSAYTPPPPEGFVSPMTWGFETNVKERFQAAGIPETSVSFRRETYVFEYAKSPRDFVNVFREFYGPTMNAFEAAEKNGKSASLLKELQDLFESQNQSGSNERTSIPATYLRVVVRV